MPLRHPRTSLVATVAASALLGATLTAPAYAGKEHHPQQPRLEPRTHFTMEPDGSSGAREDGAGIPNIDSREVDDPQLLRRGQRPASPTRPTRPTSAR